MNPYIGSGCPRIEKIYNRIFPNYSKSKVGTTEFILLGIIILNRKHFPWTRNFQKVD